MCFQLVESAVRSCIKYARREPPHAVVAQTTHDANMPACSCPSHPILCCPCAEQFQFLTCSDSLHPFQIPQLGALNDFLLPAVLDEPKRAPRTPKQPKQRPAAGRKRLAEPGGWRKGAIRAGCRAANGDGCWAKPCRSASAD